MQVCIKGAAKEVGRSAILVKTNSESFLLDYGLKPLPKGVDFPLPIHEKLDAIFISHGHLDHLGALPILMKRNIPVFGNEITSHFIRLLLADTLKIAKQDGYFIGFDEEDIKAVLRNFQPIGIENVEIGNTNIKTIDAGHIPGSYMFLLENSKSLLYTGDFKLSDTRLVKGATSDVEADALVMESTYSDKNHPDRKEEEERLIEFINETLDNDGVMLMPAFAISRSQELLLILNEYGIKTPIFVDGMAASATEIINAYPELQKEYNSLKKAMQRLDIRYVDASQRKKIIKQPCIIITGSGMLEGGAILEYVKRLHNKDNCSIALTGFQVPGTAGHSLINTGKISIDGKEIKVEATIKQFDFSSHASRDELFKLVEKVNPEKVFCIHGEKTEEFARELRERGFDAISPDANCYIDL
jgi:putative mRNA 3-end processing factor